MKAMVHTTYGPPDVLRLEEVDQPIPAGDDVLVQVFAAGINFGDWAFVRGAPFMVRLMDAGLFKPKYPILGSDIAGRVAAVGEDVQTLQPGDEVFADVTTSGWGGFAEYVAVPERALARKPANVTFVQAAATPQAATTALQGLRDVGHIKPGQKVLVNGASGGIGSFAVQIARAFGADVTGVCSTRNVAMVRALGASQVIDYTETDFARNGQRYDLILATAGYRSIFDYRRALTPTGTYVMVGGAMGQIFQAMLLGPLLSKAGSKQLKNLSAQPSNNDLRTIKELIEAGKVKPVVDRCYPLLELADALRYYGTGRARGKVVVSVTPEGTKEVVSPPRRE